MQRGMIRRRCVVVLRMWAVVAAIESGRAAGQDANETWVAANHLWPGWRSMEVTTYYPNPQSPQGVHQVSWRRVRFWGEILVTDPNGLIGLSAVPTDVLALDEAGNPIDAAGPEQATVSYQPWRHATTLNVDTGEFIVEIMPYSLSIDMSMYPPFPAAFSRVEWSMDALLSDSFETIDLPFAPTDGWIELVPGLEILVEQATAGQSVYRYTTKARYDWKKISYPPFRGMNRGPGSFVLPGSEPYSWADANLPEIIVTEIDVLDAQGNSLRLHSEGTLVIAASASDSGDQRIATRTVTGSCSLCGRATLIRYVVAFAPYVQRLRFELESVPVPGF